jgi:hypothetical protein
VRTIFHFEDRLASPYVARSERMRRQATPQDTESTIYKCLLSFALVEKTTNQNYGVGGGG